MGAIVKDRVGHIITKNANVVYAVYDSGSNPGLLRHGVVISEPTKRDIKVRTDRNAIVHLRHPHRVAVV